MLIEGIIFFEILFELTIFFLLIVFVGSIVKNYVLPMLHGEIQKIKKDETDLEDKNKLLISSKKRIEGEIDQQNKTFFILEKKMQQWGESLEEENKNIEKENGHVLKIIKEKRRKQENNLGLLKIQQKVVPESIELAYKEIFGFYSGENGQVLLKELIVKIEPK